MRMPVSNTRIFASLALVCLQVCLFSQIQVTGVVQDAQTEETLIGVNITISEANTGTVTEIDGSYQIEAPSEKTVLVFSFIGYQNQEIEVGAQKVINVFLEPDAEQLDEVVVTALGIDRQKRELGYSTQSFDGEDLELSNAPNLVNALSGKSAGVRISSANGVDGGTTRIVIRGNNNIDAENQPLIVVDGVPLENHSGMTDIGRGVDWGSAINNINPQDIESVNILKGPTAAALYGSRGANGVVMIKTKRGTKRKGLGVDYTVTHKIIQPFRYRDVQNVFGAGGPISLSEPTFETDADGNFIYPTDNHALNGPFGTPTTELFGFYSTGVSWGPRMEGQMIKWWDGEMRPFSPQPDNLKQYFQNGNTTTHNLSFSGGGDNGTMRVSLTRTDHDAVIPNSNYEQTSVNLGSNLNISDKIHADIALNYINYRRLNSPTLGDNNERSFGKGILYSWPRSYKGLEREFDIQPDGSRFRYEDISYPFTFSPPHLWWNTYKNNTKQGRDKLIGSVALAYDITPWLNATGRLGLDFTLTQFETRNTPINTVGVDGGHYSNQLSREFVNNNEFLITAHKDDMFDQPLNVRFSVGGTQWERNLYGIRGSSGNWINPHLYAFNNFKGTGVTEVIGGLPGDTLQVIVGDTITVPIPATNFPSEVRWNKKINSLYGFLNIHYNDFLFLELTGRNDWSSSLPSDANSYFYPGASLSFIATEAFEIKYDWLSFLKIRAAAARTATDTDPFLLDFVYSTGNFGGNQTAALPGTIPPLELAPQLANSYEFGATIGLFNDKINFDFTYYYISSFSQIIGSPIPVSSGATALVVNTGELENKGIEATLGITLIQNRNFFWETEFNISRNNNFLKALGDGAERIEIGSIWGLNGPAISVEVGQNYGTIVGYDYIYHEETGKPILNDEGTHYLFTDHRVPVGNASPDFIGGWSMRMGYKGLTLSTLVDTKWGGDLYAGSYVIGLQTGQSPETLVERQGGGLPYTDPDGITSNIGVILDGVYADGTPNDKVVHYYFKHVGNTGGWGHFLTTPGIIENTWVKLREVALTYQLPTKLIGSKIFQKLSISLVGRDLFYLYTTLPDRVNPEGENGTGNAQGLEWAAFPSMRSFSLGLNASF